MTSPVTKHTLPMRRNRWLAASMVGVAVLALHGQAFSWDDRPDPEPHRPSVGDDDVPTFARDVAPILQESCQSCHQPMGMGPMSLLTYEETRPWAPLIRDRVARRLMPPWHMSPDVKRAFKNDISLTDDEIETIVRWVDGGAPLGDPADLPPPRKFPDYGDWTLPQDFPGDFGPPDLIVRSTPYTVIPDGMDQWHEPRVPFEGFEETRWLRAAEIKPSYPHGFKVLHHGHASFNGNPFVRQGVGKNYDIMPDDTGIPFRPGPGSIGWSLHYFPIGDVIENDVVEVGVWFYPEGKEPKHASVGEQRFLIDSRLEGQRRGNDLVIPPHEVVMSQGIHVLQQPARIHSARVHMHLRGTAQSMEAIYPDGTRELLSHVDRFQHNWHTTHIYEDWDAPLLPKGTMLIFHSWHDNTADNPWNPDPDQWVVWGARSVDEMSHQWTGVTYFEEEEFEELLAERARILAERARQEELAGLDRD